MRRLWWQTRLARVAVLVTLPLTMLIHVPAASAATETKPLLVALCHGNNQSWPQNYPTEYYEQMFTEDSGVAWSVADYWSDVSMGQFSIAGSKVVDVELDVPRDAIANRAQGDFQQCKDGLEGVDWDQYSGPIVFTPQTLGRLVEPITNVDTEIKVEADGASVLADWAETPFIMVITKTGTTWNGLDNYENVKVTNLVVNGDEATLTVERGQPGLGNGATRIPAPKAFPANTQVKDIADTYGAKNVSAMLWSHAGPSINNQEVGHFFGFDHSRALSTSTGDYGDCFDIMSTLACADTHYYDIAYEYEPGKTVNQLAGPGMTSILLDEKGWLPADQIAHFNPDSCNQQTYNMRALGLEGDGLKQVRVPARIEIANGENSSTFSEYFAVELRSQQFTWDQGIPRDAFVLHLKGEDGRSYLVDNIKAGGRRGMVAPNIYFNESGLDGTRYFFVNSIDQTAGTGEITVANCPFTSEITYTGPTTFDYHTEQTVAATLALDNGAIAPDATITFTMGGDSCMARTNHGGECPLDIAMKPGSYNLTARWEGIPDKFEPAEVVVPVTVAKRGSDVSVDGDLPDTTYHDPITLQALLQEEPHEDDDPESHVVEGRDVVLRLGGGSTAQSCTAETTANGIAACTIDSVQQLPGEVPVTAIFAGDDYYTGSIDVGSVTVLRRATALTVETLGFAPDGGSAELTGTLVEDGGTPIAGRSLVLSLGTGGAQSCTATPTDAGGEASCEITMVDQQLGPQDITATFAGDDYYLPSNGAGELIVFAWTSGGNFVIGDGDASTGSSATYWSSEWYLENSVSGGNVDESFKGFADSPSGPNTCGAPWRSFGGNSVGPPSDVPEYTAVLVTDQMQKAGRTSQGSTAAIAIVRVDPGFQPDPGHPATATVLGEYCKA